VQFSLPTSKTYTFSGSCNGNLTFSISKIASSVLQTISVSVSSPNLTGKIAGITSMSDIWGTVQSKTGVSGESYTEWTDLYWFNTDSKGNYALGIPEGTYRLVLHTNYDTPNPTLVDTYSSPFTVSTSNVVLNLSMSTDPNFIFTINPTAVSAGSWVGFSKKSNGPKGAFGQVSGTNVRSNGTIRTYLEPGIYKLLVYPNKNSEGYVYTESPEITITAGGDPFVGLLNLNIANLKFVVSPAQNAADGYVTLLDPDGNSTTAYLDSEGVAETFIAAGTYSVTIYPGNPSANANVTTIPGLVVTGSGQRIEVTLARGNVSGIVSPTSTSAGAHVYVEEKLIDGSKTYWNRKNIDANIDENGKFTLAVPAGTYRIWAEANTPGKFIRTPSAEFIVGTSDVTVPITLRTANVSGSVSPLGKAVNGSVYVSSFNGSQPDGYDFWAPIKIDGTFEMALPEGKYRIKASANGQSQDYFGIESGEITVSSTPQIVNLSLVAANVSGTISPTNKSRYGWASIEKLNSGNWSDAGVTFGISSEGKYSVYLPLGTYRARIYPNSETTGVYRTTTDSFTVVTGSNIFDFTLPTTNFTTTILPADRSPRTMAIIEKLQSQGYFQYYDSTIVNSSGKLEAYLPNGRYRLQLKASDNSFSNTTSASFDIPTSSQYPIPLSITLNTPNVSGIITPALYAGNAQVCIEKLQGSDYDPKSGGSFFQTLDCTTTDQNGRYSFNVENGTYRIIVTPASVLYKDKLPAQIANSPYTTTTSDNFVISGDVKVINVALSTGNLTGTIGDVAKSAGGWIQVLETSGAYPQMTRYRTNITNQGKYAIQLPAGQYRLQIYPQENVNGAVRTETSDFTIGGSSVVFDATLDSPNVTGVITPIDKSANGWVNAEQYSCKCGWAGWSGAPGIAASSGIRVDGTYQLRVNDGLTRVIAYPPYNATGVTRTTSNSFTASNSMSTISFSLSEGNLRGTISSVTNSAGGYVRVEKKNGNYWDWTNYGTSILEDGTFRLDVPDGTYRLVATPGWKASGVVETPSPEFTIAGSVVTENLTLLAPNLTGSVSNLAAHFNNAGLNGGEAKYVPAAFAQVIQKIGNSYYGLNKYVTIYADGSYSTYLPNGTYHLWIYSMVKDLTGLSRINTDDFVISASNLTFDFTLGEANLRGTVSPISSSRWGWVCAEKQGGSSWIPAGCETTREDGTYAMRVDPGTYRITANSAWNSIGYSKSTSDIAVVGSSGITTLDSTLTPSNVKLTILDTLGKPNYEGWVTAKTLSGTYQDTGKGWISQLGKVDFTLAAGDYVLEIQPGNSRSGVRTTVNINVPASGVFESIITLSAGNVQGVAKNSLAANISCAFISATAPGKETLRTISKSDGTFTLNLEAGVLWTIGVLDSTSGEKGSATLTPNNSSSNPLTVITAP
jgi:hypothetical protein